MNIFRDYSESPVLITGMHRSGTTMITKMVSEAGGFFGNDIEHNHESEFFIELNDWLLDWAGGRWDHPSPIHYLVKNDKLSDIAVNYLMDRFNSMRSFSYRGVMFSPMDRETWGYKDPRNIFTIPFWIKVFPSMKIINIYRNGVDVASSLVARDRSSILDASNKYNKSRWKYRFIGKKSGFTFSDRCFNYDDAFGLWEEYVRQGMKNDSVYKDRTLSVRYEDVLENPEREMGRIFEFCDLVVDKNKVSLMCDNIDSGRAYAFHDDEVLSDFYGHVKDNSLMRSLGY